MKDEVYFDPDEQYLVYQIYPEPENPAITETVEDHSTYSFTSMNTLYLIITEERHAKLSEELPKWTTLQKVGPTGIEDMLKLIPSQKKIFEDARIWKPSKGPRAKKGRR